jgi:hypothetical protein
VHLVFLALATLKSAGSRVTVHRTENPYADLVQDQSIDEIQNYDHLPSDECALTHNHSQICKENPHDNYFKY